MSLKGLYYVETGHGCTVLEATSSKAAYNAALRSVGTSVGVRSAAPATMQNLQRVSGMGGRLPAKARKLLEKQS